MDYLISLLALGAVPTRRRQRYFKHLPSERESYTSPAPESKRRKRRQKGKKK